MAGIPKDVMKLFRKLSKNNEVKIVKKGSRNMRLGFMVNFIYDPKHKATLPYYDKLPIAIVLARQGDRFLGINLHHIPWSRRIQLAEALMRRTKNKNRITYKDIKSAWKSAKLPLALAYVCIRSYLYSHIKSDVRLFSWETYRDVAKDVKPQFEKQSKDKAVKKSQSSVYKYNMDKYRNQKKKVKGKK